MEYAVDGTLQNGDALNTIYDDLGGTLAFNVPAAVLEASSVVSLRVMLLLGVVGLVVSCRCKEGVVR